MGACLSSLCNTDKDGDSPRQVPRRKSRSHRGSAHGRQDYYGNSMHRKAPDFGVASFFRVMDLLGEGGTGQTYLCQELRSARRVAIKFMPRPLAKILVPMVSQEIQLQAQLSEGHIGLVRVESALLSRTHLGLVMEYVDGGTLTQYVMKRSQNRGERGGLHLTEDEARYFFRQLVSAVEYLHKSHVAHRDLKMCNVVLTQRRPPTLKLCDFGFAKGWDDSSVMNTRIGTPVYMSPQLIAAKNEGKAYSATAADVWACGVMLFAMMLGRFPYDHIDHPDPNSSGAHHEVWTEQMRTMDGDWASSPRVAPHIMLLSDECKDLLGKMLCTDETKRITIPDIRKHPWFTTILPPYLADALREFEERQARLAKVMEGDNEAQVKRRNKAVHDLIVMAGQHASAAGGVKPKSSSSNPISAIFEGVEGDGASITSSKPPALGGGDTASSTPGRRSSVLAGSIAAPEADRSVRGKGGKGADGADPDRSVRRKSGKEADADKSVRGGKAGKGGESEKSVRFGNGGKEADPDRSVRGGKAGKGADPDRSVRGGKAGKGADPDRSVRGGKAGKEAQEAPVDLERSVRRGKVGLQPPPPPEESELLHQEQDVIMIELAAVARRTKSDGVLLMNTYMPEGQSVETEGARRCDSEDTDPVPECGSSGDSSHPTAQGHATHTPTPTSAPEAPPPAPPTAAAAAVAGDAAAAATSAAADREEIQGCGDGGVSAAASVGGALPCAGEATMGGPAVSPFTAASLSLAERSDSDDGLAAAGANAGSAKAAAAAGGARGEQ